MDNDALLIEAVCSLFATERANLDRLEATGHLTVTERQKARKLRTVAAGGRRSRALTDDSRLLLQQFTALGAKAILSTGSPRAGDFLNNQLRGRWAERVVLSLNLPQFRLVPFGPSGAAMPGQEDHRRIVATYREIELLEGKRPDLLAFGVDAWSRLTDSERNRVLEWSERLLAAEDLDILRAARFGVEVKNSTWHFGRRRAHHSLDDDDEDRGRLSITVKHEELDKIVGWMVKTGKPLLFFQVLFDEVYCMAFSRMVDAMRNGFLYVPGDYLKDSDTGAGGKLYHRFFLSDTRHRAAFVRFPDASIAHVEVLANGSVIPYVELSPAEAYDPDAAVVDAELRVAEGASAAAFRLVP